MYLDDMIVFDVEESSVQELLAILGMQIRIEDKGVSEWFLRIKNHVGEKSITVSQENYVKKQSKNGLCKNFKPVYEPVVTSKNATDDKILSNCSSFQQ